LDVATTQNRKKKCLKQARLDIPRDVLLVPINFDEESITGVLENAGYDHDRKTLFLWEGVCYYLEPESVDATLEFVSQSRHRDSLVAFDYIIPVSEENMDRYYGVRKFRETMENDYSEESFKFAIDEDEIASFLSKRGLTIVDHLDNKEIEERFLVDENGSSIGQITGLFRLVSASPATP
jgi:methyltransferase (TIGR00027 family)